MQTQCWFSIIININVTPQFCHKFIFFTHESVLEDMGHMVTAIITWVNMLKAEYNGHHFCGYFRLHHLSWRFRAKAHFDLFLRIQVTTKSASVQVISWRRKGDMPSPELKLTKIYYVWQTVIPKASNISDYTYRQVSNIRRTKFQHLKDSRTVLRLSLPNPLKPDVKSRMKM